MAVKPPAQPWRSTPLIESTSLSRAAGYRVHLKLDNLQPAGSFKSRGVGNYMLVKLAEAQSKKNHAPVHFYISSGGNAGLAAVHASRSLDLPCTVVVPMTTQPTMIAKIKEAGAHDVVQRGASWRFADEFLKDELLAKDAGGVYVPPFDHPDVWNGNATMLKEVANQWRVHNAHRKLPSAIVCSVGGGGLFCGLMQASRELGNGWEDVPLVAMETIGCDSLNQSVVKDEHITLPAITSMARCLGAVRVATTAFEWATGRRQSAEGEASTSRGKTNVISATLTDAEAAMGCYRFAEGERMLVELACGVNVAVCFDGRLEKILGRKLAPDDEVVIVVCGGSDVTLESLDYLKEHFNLTEPQSHHDGANGTNKS